VEDFYRRLLTRSFDEGTSAGPFRKAREQGFLPVPAKERRGKDRERYSVRSVLAECLPRIAEDAVGKEEKETVPAQKGLILFASPTRGGLDQPCDWVDEIDHAEPVMVHPRAADALGLGDGDRVVLKGPAGEIRTRVRLSEGIHPEAVAMAAATLDRESKVSCPDEAAPDKRSGLPHRWWAKESYGGNARKVVPWPKDPNREPPGWMGTTVTLMRPDKNSKG
jgi:hypothetical protein